MYESYFELRKKTMDKNDVVRLLTVQTELCVQEKDAIYCFGMSKMTCVVETTGSEKHYYFLKFVEFLELMGRVAHFKFTDSSMSLVTKLENVLDEVLGTMSIKRLDPVFTVVDESEPDSDY